MKTFKYYPTKFFTLILINLFVLNLSAQQAIEKKSIQLDTVSIVSDQQAFEDMVCSLVLDENFEYRKALKKSRVSKKYYIFSDTKIFEVDVLKYFKRAARKSESIQEFTCYFHEKKLDFMDILNHEDISSLYSVFRKGTFNEFLRKLDSSLSSLY